MNSKISINLDTLKVEKEDELLEVFNISIENNTVHFEVSRPEAEYINPPITY